MLRPGQPAGPAVGRRGGQATQTSNASALRYPQGGTSAHLHGGSLGMAGSGCIRDLVNWLIAEYVDLRAVQHLLLKNQELCDELRTQYNITSLVPLHELTRIDGQDAENVDQVARFGSKAAGPPSGAPEGHSSNCATFRPRDPQQRAFAASPLSPGGCQMGPIPCGCLQVIIRPFPTIPPASQPPPGATERGSLPPPALQGFPPCSSPDIQQLPQAGSLFSPGGPPRALGQTSSPQGPASSSSGAHSAPRAPHPGPFLPQAPAGPRGLQPPPPGRKAQKSPSPGPAALPDPAQILPPAGPPAALPTRTPTLQRPPDVHPKEHQVLANRKVAMKRGSNVKSKDSKQETMERIVGEMAYQLDHRILSTIFPEVVDFYGFSVHNIPKKVMQRGNNPCFQLNPEQAFAIVERYITIMNRLKPLGYDRNVHPRLTEQLVNTFGLFLEPPPEADFYNNIWKLWTAVKEAVSPELHDDCRVLLNCLQQLSQEDGKPLFVW